MSLEIDVLRALLRLARRRTPPTLEQLTVRVNGDEADVRRALGSLSKRGLVQRTPAGLRLSLAGLAVAVAFAQRVPAKKRVSTPRKQRPATGASTDAAAASSLPSSIEPARPARHRAA